MAAASRFLVFLPNGKVVEVAAAEADVQQDKATGLIVAVQQRQRDGSIRRYEGFPVMIETEAPGRIEQVKALPPGLVGGHEH